MSREQIKTVFLANGFKVKPQADGQPDLNPYVYEAAQALLGEHVGYLSPSGAFHTVKAYMDLAADLCEFSKSERAWFSSFRPVYACPVDPVMIGAPGSDSEGDKREQGMP